mmetsp:Transcript_15696/g.35347  ORF Transcript_15696/g.35347 Transcript_15696/m.35347 type:complete len:98 (-) Transcript_15696:1397-1690(-)
MNCSPSIYNFLNIFGSLVNKYSPCNYETTKNSKKYKLDNGIVVSDSANTTRGVDSIEYQSNCSQKQIKDLTKREAEANEGKKADDVHQYPHPPALPV